ncbi:hypothetical protein [Thalassoglobus sp.]|uniref:hypothetical protein n=1 Tax=Thalassoglobus sp. TaxID=2795869 RepID=UPI003AA7E5D3
MTKLSHNSNYDRVQRRLTILLRLFLVVGIGMEATEQLWGNVVIASGILLLTYLPAILARRADVHVPPEFEVLTIAFIIASLFLGEVRDYYNTFWWWDIALHGTSGGLLGVLGVLLIYVLNETPQIDLQMRPGFVAFFAFCFALSVGALWEIFEFTMDQYFGMNMQKPMWGDPSGLTDTMIDLIVDAIGALIVSVVGYIYMVRGYESVIDRGIQRFIARNPRLFSRGQSE